MRGAAAGAYARVPLATPPAGAVPARPAGTVIRVPGTYRAYGSDAVITL